MKDVSILKQLQVIPGVGPSIAQDLMDLGYSSVYKLKKANPETMYKNLYELRSRHIDRCVLYVFRCAVYFATVKEPVPELLKWWNWKDKRLKTGTS